MRLRRTSMIATLALLASVGLGVPTQAQTANRADEPQGSSTAPPIHDDAVAAAAAEHRRMMGEMQASAKKLEGLVANMNAASGEAKVEHIAAIINELVAQHNGMMRRMMSMHEGDMMRQMMQKMRANSPSDDGASMPKSEKPEADPDHTQHHPPVK